MKTEKQLRQLAGLRNDKFEQWSEKEQELNEGHINDHVYGLRNTAPVDLLIEAMTSTGGAPNLVYDDNGHFALSFVGFNPVNMEEEGPFKEDVNMQSFVEPGEWAKTIREAVVKSIEERYKSE